jgi:hypothetical protein
LRRKLREKFENCAKKWKWKEDDGTFNTSLVFIMEEEVEGVTFLWFFKLAQMHTHGVVMAADCLGKRGML